jgi:recombination protein RecT
MSVNNSLVKKVEKKTFSAFLTQDAIKHQINDIVGGKDGQRFITAILSAVSINPILAECEHGSILSAALLGESLKLSPSPQLGQYYLVPFNKKGKNGEPDTKVAQFQLGYKGYIQLAIRSGYYKKLNVLAIKENELVRFDPLNEEIEVNLIADEIERDNAKTIGYYAMFEYQNGFKKSIYWSKEKMLKHANTYSSAFNSDTYKKIQDGKIAETDMWKYSSFWYKDFDGMAYKTMLRQLISKWGIMSIEMQQAFESDMAAIKEDGTPEYVDNQSDTIDITEQGQAELIEKQEEVTAKSPFEEQQNSLI